MKMSKRIFIVVLTVALLISCLAFSASAEEVTLENYASVLDYYEQPTIFGLDFSLDGVDYSDEIMIQNSTFASGTVVEDAAAPGGKYLNLVFKGGRPTTKGNLYLNWNADESVSDFYLDMTVSGSKNTGNPSFAPKLNFIIGESSFTDVSTGAPADTSILVLDFETGSVKYSVIEEGEVVAKEAAGVLTQGAWYSVAITYSVTDSLCTVDIVNVDDASNAFSFTTTYLPYEAINNVRVGVHNANYTAGNIIGVANINAGGGLVRRDTADPQGAIESYVLGMYEIFRSDVDKAEKVNVCTVTNKLISYGFTSDKADVNTALDALKVGGVTLYSDEIENCLAEYATLTQYDEKRAIIDANLDYASILSGLDLSPVGDDKAAAIQEGLDKFYDIDEALKKAESDSLAFIAALAGVEDVLGSTDYSLLNAYYEAAIVYAPDITYEGVSEVYELFVELEADMSDITVSAERFIELVNKANDGALSFVERYNIYVTIEDNFFDNETYPGVTEALALYHDVVSPYMEHEISLAENFITYVKKAEYAVYISAKQANLDIAKGYMDTCEPTFAGVAEAKVLYAEIVKYVESKLELANAYIAAVNAIDGKTGAALTAAIENAKKLQESGNVLGVAGITEANIKLDDAIAALELPERYCTYFISVVDSIANAKDAAERYNLLVEAKAAEADADKSYPGVTEASAKLASAITAYNNDVNKVNSVNKTATEVAINTCGVGKTANTVSTHVIALVKKLFDEE